LPLATQLQITSVTQGLTQLYPLLKKLRFRADCFALSPPPDLNWDRGRLKLLGESDCPAVQAAFSAHGGCATIKAGGMDLVERVQAAFSTHGGCASKVTINSTVATLSIALDLCSDYGEGLLIANESTLQRLILGPGAPHGALAMHVWAHVVIAGNRMTGLDNCAHQEEQQFQTGVIYFARGHDVGCHNPQTQPRSSLEEVRLTCAQLQAARMLHRLGPEPKSYAHTEDTVATWQAAAERTDRQPIGLSREKADACYTVTLGPGVVRYMKLETFLEADVEAAVAHIRSLSESPAIEFQQGRISPSSFAFSGALIAPIADHLLDWIELNLAGMDAMAQGEPWDTRLRIHHKLCRFCLTEAMPSSVYAAFHGLLHLKTLAPEECLKAWVRQACDRDIFNSYVNDPGHIFAAYGGFAYVFAKTPFVLQRLSTVQQEDAERNAAMESELLRRSKFDCFIYLMEDLRNGSFKIGRSKTPGMRERTLHSEVPQVVMRFSIPAEEGREGQLHNHFESKRRRGEWFALTNDDLIWIVAFLKANGDGSRAIVDYNWLGGIYLGSTPIAPNE
jgi:hypothetical protein